MGHSVTQQTDGRTGLRKKGTKGHKKRTDKLWDPLGERKERDVRLTNVKRLA